MARMGRGVIESLRDLRSFVAAAETRSMTVAGRRLGYSQPAISLHIRALERQVGTPLFVRGFDGLELTVDGERLLETARAVLELCEGFTLSERSVPSASVGAKATTRVSA